MTAAHLATHFSRFASITRLFPDLSGAPFVATGGRGKDRTAVRLLLPSTLMDLRRSRIHDAQRAGLRNRIRDHWHVSDGKADVLLEAWATEAKARGLEPGRSAYWQDGEVWIQAQIDARS